jgi:hypothetical protein
MLKRSYDNKEAALLLLSADCFDSSVVAFYYAVLQRMMYALNNAEKRPLQYDKQNPLDENIHFKILTEIKNRLPGKEEECFDEQFMKLFGYRKKADYSLEPISQDDCLDCRGLYEWLIGKLDRYFPIKEG